MPPNSSGETLCATTGEFHVKKREARTDREQRRIKRINSKFPHTCRVCSIRLHFAVLKRGSQLPLVGNVGARTRKIKVQESLSWMCMRSKLAVLSLLLAVPVIPIAQTQNVDTTTLTEM